MACWLIFIGSLHSLLIFFDVVVTEAVVEDQSSMVDTLRHLVLPEELGDVVAD